MEAAGWQLARHCRARTAVLCGTGNNGGDALAAARHLARWGRLQSVACSDRAGLSGPAARQAKVLEAQGVAILPEPALEGAQLIVDGLLGIGLHDKPRALLARWIEIANASGKRIVSVDLPSGLDADSGKAYVPAIRADLTVTFGLPKAGLLSGDGPQLAGVIWLADIGIPPAAYGMVGAPMPDHLYAMHDRVELRGIAP